MMSSKIHNDVGDVRRKGERRRRRRRRGRSENDRVRNGWSGVGWGDVCSVYGCTAVQQLNVANQYYHHRYDIRYKTGWQ
jgi:hypothetical protein